jgi:hypothetical protein
MVHVCRVGGVLDVAVLKVLRCAVQQLAVPIACLLLPMSRLVCFGMLM